MNSQACKVSLSALAVAIVLSTLDVSAQTNSFPLSLQKQNSNARLLWPSQSGERFQIEFRTNLQTSFNWNLLSTNWPAGSGAETEFVHTNVLNLSAGFYRVLRFDTPAFTFDWSGTNFTYSDAQRTFTGIMLKPAGNGPFPAVIISHGAGGTANGYSLAKAREMLTWGMVCIGPTMTHAAGGETNAINMGNCPENISRAIACANVLATLSYVDTNRLALFGHSMGAFATIGDAAVLTNRFRAAAITAGGVIPDSAGTSNAAPTVTEAQPVRMPFLMFHCDADPVVPPIRSELFQQVLNTNAVANQRIVYSSNSIANPNNWHNIHNDTAINTDVLTNTFQWFKTHGVLPQRNCAARRCWNLKFFHAHIFCARAEIHSTARICGTGRALFSARSGAGHVVRSVEPYPRCSRIARDSALRICGICDCGLRFPSDFRRDGRPACIARESFTRTFACYCFGHGIGKHGDKISRESLARARIDSTPRILFVSNVEHFFDNCFRATGRRPTGIWTNPRNGHAGLDGGLLDRELVECGRFDTRNLRCRDYLADRLCGHIFSANRRSTEICRASHLVTTSRARRVDAPENSRSSRGVHHARFGQHPICRILSVCADSLARPRPATHECVDDAGPGDGNDCDVQSRCAAAEMAIEMDFRVRPMFRRGAIRF